MNLDKLVYDDVKLGVKGVEMYESGASFDEIEKKSPIYLNTSDVFYGLNVTDLIVMGVLTGGNTLLTGRSGCGKSQVASDIAEYFFDGNVDVGGRSVLIEGHPDLRVLEDIFTDIDREKMARVFNNKTNANYINMEELNRCPPISQNQFFSLLNNRLILSGQEVSLGDGFCSTISTVNLGNGDYKGTFESDTALYNRFGLVLNLDERELENSYRDRKMLDVIRSADSKLKKSPRRDIFNKISGAYNEIRKKTLDLGLEAEAVLEFIKEGLNRCSVDDKKDKDWNIQNRKCQACDKNDKGVNNSLLCASINSVSSRTINNVRLYSAGLDYMLGLKDIKGVSARDIVFKAFELVGAYSGCLNPFISAQKFYSKNSTMMKNVVNELREIYSQNEDRILTSLLAAQRGVPINSLFCLKMPGEKNVLLRGLEDGDEKILEKKEEIEKRGGSVDNTIFQFEDDILGWSWVKDASDFLIDEYNRNKKPSKKRKGKSKN